MLLHQPQRGCCAAHVYVGACKPCAPRRLVTGLAAAQPAAAAASAAGPAQGSIPGSTTCSVCIGTTASDLRGLQAMRPVEKGGLLLSLPITHVLAVPDTPDSAHHWHTSHVKAFEQMWQMQLPPELLDVLSDVSTYSEAVRLAVLLLWVRRHVAAPFWQQWVQQLPPAQEYTASGPAWGTEAIDQLQWPALMVCMKHYSGIKANHMHQVVELLTSSPLSKLQLSGEGGPEDVATWALQAVATRAQGGPVEWGCTVLVPYSDMANHSTTAAVAEGASTANYYGLAATQDIQEGHEVLLCYHQLASSEDLLHVWGFLERGNPNDRPYPIQRPLQALPRLPWEVVLAAAGRLHDLVQLGPQALQQQQQQQQGVSLSPGDLAALTDGQPVNRVLAAASSLPLAWDTTLEQLDSIAKLDAAMLLEACQPPGTIGDWCDLADGMQDALWRPWAQHHIMQAVRSRLDSRASAPTAAPRAAAAATPRAIWDSPQQRWEATLAALTARLLGLHARVGLLSVPTTLEEDLALEGAILSGSFASLTPEQVAGLLEGRQEDEQEAALEALHARLLKRTMEVAALQAAPCDSSSSHAAVEQLQAGLADLGAQLGALTEHRRHASWRCEQMDKLQQLAQEAPSRTGAAAAAAGGAGVDPCVLLAIQARLQQKMLIHVYGLLCDAMAGQSLPVLSAAG